MATTLPQKTKQAKAKPKRKLSTEFKHPYVYSNWCEIVRLDGADLVNGEKLEIQFEDGSVETHKIRVRKSSYTAQDHSQTCTIPVTQAFITLDYRGTKTQVELTRKFKARRA